MNQRILDQDSEEESKATALKALGENFGKPLSPQLIDLWLELLTSYPAPMVSLAVKNVIERYEYKTLPPFAVLKNALDDLSGVSEKTLELQAIAEWNILTEAMPKYGSDRKPPLHPTTDYVLKIMGGWMTACCYWNLKDMEFKRKDFIRLWMESHGRVEQMQIGAGGVMRSLVGGQDRGAGLVGLSSTLKAITAGDASGGVQ